MWEEQPNKPLTASIYSVMGDAGEEGPDPDTAVEAGGRG